MYKKQMKFQKIICYLELVASVLVFIYSLGMMTDIYGNLYTMVPDPKDLSTAYVDGAAIFYEMQPFNKALTVVGLVLIILAVFMLIMNTHTRRRYYISNYISICLMSAASFCSAIWGIVNVMKYRHQYLTTIDFETLESYLTIFKKTYVDSTFWLDINIFVFGFLIITTGLLIFNLIWKTNLTKEEKALIAQGKEEK